MLVLGVSPRLGSFLAMIARSSCSVFFCGTLANEINPTITPMITFPDVIRIRAYPIPNARFLDKVIMSVGDRSICCLSKQV